MVAEREVSMFPVIIVDLSISQCRSVRFYSTCFEALLFGDYSCAMSCQLSLIVMYTW